MSPDPFAPYAIAVELTDEKMVGLGQVASGVAPGSGDAPPGDRRARRKSVASSP